MNANPQRKGLQPNRLLPLIALIPILGFFGYIQFTKLQSRPRRVTAPDTGTLKVETDPAGVELYLDGRLENTTPATVTGIRCGEHTLQLMMRGFQSVEKTVVITKDTETAVDETLVRIEQACLIVTSEPSRATVYLDGQRLGRTPTQLDNLRPGAHDLRLQRPASRDFRQEVLLEPGERKELHCNLQPVEEQTVMQQDEAPPAEGVDDLVRCVELLHRQIQHGELEQTTATVTRAIELASAPDADPERRNWVQGEIAKPYLCQYSYGDAAAVERCRAAIESALLSQAKRQPEQAWARALLLKLAHACERWKQLSELLGPEGLAADRNDTLTLALYGEALVKAGQPEEAVKALSPAFRRNKKCWRLNYVLGLAYAQSGERVKARIKFKQALLHCNDEGGKAAIRTALSSD